MTMPALSLQIEMLSQTEAQAIWKRQTKRAPNFADYQMFMNTHDVGASWRTKVEPGDQNEEHAKVIRHNFNEAARERTAIIRLDAKPANGTEVQGIAADQFTSGPDGKWRAEKPAPVAIKWKVNSHKEKREVADAKGKKTTIEIDVIDSLTALITATAARQTRAPRAANEDVTALVTTPPADAKKGTKYTLPDGRVAVRTEAGKWRAPKHSANGLVDGTTDVSTGNNGTSVTPTPVATT